MAEITAGQLVEICPYGKHHSHHYLGHLDGERGQVIGLKEHGKDLKVAVRLSGSRTLVDFPIQVVKPVRNH